MDWSDKKTWLLLGVLFIGLAFLAKSCIFREIPNEEARIRQVIQGMCDAVENKAARELTSHLDEEYSDSSRLTKPEIHRFMLGKFLQTQSSLACLAVVESIEFQEDNPRRATAIVRAGVYEGFSLAELVEPKGGQAFEFEVRFRKDLNEDWKVLWHSRERFDPLDAWHLYMGDDPETE